MSNIDQKTNEIKYVDLNGLKVFAEELKLYLQNHILEFSIYNELKDIIENNASLKSSMIPVTYNELVNLRNRGELIAGMQYRIIDYVTTTTQDNTTSAGHQFDIIVTADSESTLNEVARVCLHDGDTYFSQAGSNLAAWQIWYSLDNDTSRFAWAVPDTSGGKGVIYRMIDEFNNDCPYDFKNIQFKRGIYADGQGLAKEEGDQDYDVYCYTFSWEDDDKIIMDASIVGNNGYLLNDEGQISGVYGNLIKPYITYTGDVENPQTTCQHLNNVVFLGNYAYEERFYYGCYSNTLGCNCSYNSFGNSCYSNTLSDDCSFNSFGDDCCYNSFGHSCSSNALGGGCSSNNFVNGNTSNTLGNNCIYNSFGINCGYNTLGNNCHGNSFCDNCRFNRFGDNCSYNSFGNDCTYNKFSGASSAVVGHFYEHNHLGDGVNNCTFINSATAAYNQCVKNYNVTQGMQGKTVSVEHELDYQTTVAVDSSGNVKQFCLADIIL